jgi:hypothetical protein
LGGNGSVNWGEFWDRNRRSFGGGVSVKPDYHLNVSILRLLLVLKPAE